LVAIVTE